MESSKVNAGKRSFLRHMWEIRARRAVGSYRCLVPILQRQKLRLGQKRHSMWKALYLPYLTGSSQPSWVGCPIYR